MQWRLMNFSRECLILTNIVDRREFAISFWCRIWCDWAICVLYESWEPFTYNFSICYSTFQFIHDQNDIADVMRSLNVFAEKWAFNQMTIRLQVTRSYIWNTSIISRFSEPIINLFSVERNCFGRPHPAPQYWTTSMSLHRRIKLTVFCRLHAELMWAFVSHRVCMANMPLHSVFLSNGHEKKNVQQHRPVSYCIFVLCLEGIERASCAMQIFRHCSLFILQFVFVFVPIVEYVLRLSTQLQWDYISIVGHEKQWH